MENQPALSGMATGLPSSSGSVMTWPARLTLFSTTRETWLSCRGLPRNDRASMQPACSLASVRATSWSVSKISAIDLASDFVWIDDEPLAVEIAVLRGRNLLRRLVVIDTNTDDDGLLRARAAIETLAKGPC